MLPFAAALVKVALGGAILSTAQEDWLSVTPMPTTEIVADRGPASKLGETEMLTEPFPSPLDPDWTTAHVLSEPAVQEHAGAADTEMLNVPPPTDADKAIGLSVTVQD
jgi:hypothetical protein